MKISVKHSFFLSNGNQAQNYQQESHFYFPRVSSLHRIPKSCALIMMITMLTNITTTLLTLITHLADISFHYHNKVSLEYLAIANQKCRSIFYKLINFIRRRHLDTFMICKIDIFKRFQIVIVDGIFNILMNMFQ